MKPKLVIDTNIFVSYLLSKKSFPYKVVKEYFHENLIEHYISHETSAEYQDVLSRNKFAKYAPDFVNLAKDLMQDILDLSVLVHPSTHFNIIEDTDDNAFLDVAFESGANYLVTGNSKHFKDKQFYTTQIVSAREFCEINQPE